MSTAYDIPEPTEYEYQPPLDVTDPYTEREEMTDKEMVLTAMLHELGFKVEFIEENHPPIDIAMLLQCRRTLNLCSKFTAWRDELTKVISDYSLPVEAVP